MSRRFPRCIRRLVVKIGSRSVVDDRGRPRHRRLHNLARQLVALREAGTEVALVSSGAIALGMGALGWERTTGDVATLQALAAVGQSRLMDVYQDVFRRRGVRSAQVLLTWDDFGDRRRYNNARNTLRAILRLGAMPVINENDTIATDEIRFGDNDKLAAFVATLLDADLLVLLSDVPGFYVAAGRRRRVCDEVREITEELAGYAGGPAGGGLSKGGMAAKLDAVKMATRARVPCVVAHSGTREVLSRIVRGERIGTLFVEKEERLLARKHWISFGARPAGVVVVDEGARDALLQGGRSLLLPGVMRWEGPFRRGDVLVVRDAAGREIARGVSRYDSDELDKVADRQRRRALIHCDHLVLAER